MDARSLEVKETVSASKKLGKSEAEELIRNATSITVAKGKKITHFDGGKPTEDVVSALLGPTGNLRAPLVRSAKKILVGFNEEAYQAVLG